MMEFDFGRLQPHNRTANTPELWPISSRAHAATIHNNSGIGERTVDDKSLPVTLDMCLLYSKGGRPQECAIVHLRLFGNIQGARKSCPKSGFPFRDSRRVETLETGVGVPGGQHSLGADGFPGILAVPQQDGSAVAVEDLNRQLSQPERP